MNEENYKINLVRMWDSVRDDKFKGRNNCEGVICRECQFCDINNNDCYTAINAVEMVEVVEKWSKEHPIKKYKISRLEYDLLQTVINFGSKIDTFNDFCTLSGLLEKGYFEGAAGSMYISDYYNNCEVEDNDES